MRPPVRAQTLGAAALIVGAQRLDPSAGTIFALLLRVLYGAGCTVSREILLRTLWQGQAETRQRANLRQALYKLRQMGVQIGLEGDVVTLDVLQIAPVFATQRTGPRFEQDVTLGHEPFGLFLPGFRTGWPEYDEWLDVVRESVHADVRRVLVEQLRNRRARADWMGADAIARWLLQFDPLNEEATLTTAECSALNGSKAEAVAMLDRYLAELGPDAGDLRLQATLLRRRISEPHGKQRVSFAPTERHFIGREELMAELTLAMRRAKWHDGSATLLHGPPGMGKTRVTQELAKVAVLEGFRVVSVSCRESDQQRPLSVFLELVPELLEMPGAMGCSPESMAVLRRLVGSQMPEAHVTPGEQSVELFLPTSDTSTPARTSFRRAILDITASIADEKPMLLVVEDLQWIDSASGDVLLDMSERCGSTRIFLLATSRRAFVGSARPERSALKLRPAPLPPLPEHRLIELARALAQDVSASLTESDTLWLLASCEGNPLFLRCLVQYWVETGDVSRVPSTLAQLLEHRLDALSGNAVLVLQAASLLGRYSTIHTIQTTLELPPHQLLEAIAELERSACLGNDDSQDQVVAHELVSRTAAARLSSRVRAALHARIARALEETAIAEQHRDALPAIGHHYRLSGVAGDVSKFVDRHASQWPEVGSPALALELIDLALGADPTLTESASLAQSRIELQCAAGEYAEALAVHPGALRLPTVDFQLSSEAADAAIGLANAAYRSDPFVSREELGAFAARVAAQESLSCQTRLRSAEIGLIIAANLAEREIADACYLGSETARATSKDPVACDTVDLLFHTMFGDLSIANEIGDRLAAYATDAQSDLLRYTLLARTAFAYRITGRCERARALLERARIVAREMRTTHHVLYCEWQLSQIALDVGEMQEARNWAAGLRTYSNGETDVFTQNFCAAHLCRLAIEDGDRLEAEIHLLAYARTSPRMPSIKAAAYHVALRAGVSLLQEDWIPTDELLNVALSRHIRTAEFSTSDYLTSVLISCYVRAGRAGDGELLANAYIEQKRREQSSLSVSLQRSVRQLKSALARDA